MAQSLGKDKARQPHNRNDSSQMKDLLQFDDPEKSHDVKHKCDEEQSSKDGTSQAGCSSSSSSSSSYSCSTGDRGGRPAEGQRAEPPSLCCQLNDLMTLSQCRNKLGRLTFSSAHVVLVDVSVFNCRAGLVPQQGRDLWLSNFVKMPCSQVVNHNGPNQMSKWKVISKQLKALANKKEVSVDDVVNAIVKYNPKYKDQWSFDVLVTFVKRTPKAENYFGTLFPKIAALALQLPELVKKAIPMLHRGHSAAITLSQVQISCLLANAFFCTFPHRNTSGPYAEYGNYPSINFNSLFGGRSERKMEKLRAIMHYFHEVTGDKTKPDGLVTFERRCLRDTAVPNWRSSQETLHNLHVASHGSIETEGTGLLQVDFASSWIGGGVLGSGLLQEEILFLMNPELIVSRLFTEKLADEECLIITGSQQFSCYSGFGDTFEWAGPHEDHLARDEWARRKRQILAIDALHFKQQRDQYTMIKVTRELNKAYCGFAGQQGREEPDIATGKWGCGAFNGDPQLKALIQLMAAAKARRGLAFFTFEDEELKKSLQQLHHLLVTCGTTVAKLYGLLEDYCAEQQKPGSSHVDLFEFITKTIRGSRSQL